MMLWGCAPSKAVLAETKMIQSFFKTLKDRYDRKTLRLVFPQCIDELVAAADDENWEVYKTNNIQNCVLNFSSNTTVKRLAHIFLHTKCKSINDISVLPAGQVRTDKLREFFIPL